MKNHTVVIDQSTSATKAMLFHDEGILVHTVSIAHQQYYPRPGWVEHDAEEIFANTVTAVRELLATTAIDLSLVDSLAITNQRETVVVWDKRTGKPVCNAVVWQCNRGAALCDQLIREGRQELVRSKTGLLINPYFSASGISWILNEVPGAAEEAAKGNLLFGTMDSWLIWKLTGGRIHATDHTNASRTLLYNVQSLKWDPELFDLFAIPMSMAPEVRSGDATFGETDASWFDKALTIAGVLGDSHGALAGQLCFQPGMGKVTYGTGSSVMIQAGTEMLSAPDGLVTSVAFSALGKVYYAFEGNIHCTGATIQWLVDDLQLLNNAAESEVLATSVDDTGGVYLVPAFAGLGAPWWDPDARAVICGMTRGTKKAHVVRAALESIAYQIRDLLELVKGSGIALKEVRVDGGPVKNAFLMQFQSDQLQAPVNRSPVKEASALGVYFMNRLAMKQWHSLDEIGKTRINNEYVYPMMPPQQADSLYAGWKKAIGKSRQ